MNTYILEWSGGIIAEFSFRRQAHESEGKPFNRTNPYQSHLWREENNIYHPSQDCYEDQMK